MSMDARVEQFHTDAAVLGKAKDGKTVKEIEKLRKFIFKNQEYRFTERDQSHLFQAVQLYVTAYTDYQGDDNPALALLEDALKMPFNIFGTKQKSSMLKWLDKLNASQQGGTPAGNTASSTAKYQVIDLQGLEATMMNDDGDTYQVGLAGCSPEVRAGVEEGFNAGSDVTVELSTDLKKIVRIL